MASMDKYKAADLIIDLYEQGLDACDISENYDVPLSLVDDVLESYLSDEFLFDSEAI